MLDKAKKLPESGVVLGVTQEHLLYLRHDTFLQVLGRTPPPCPRLAFGVLGVAGRQPNPHPPLPVHRHHAATHCEPSEQSVQPLEPNDRFLQRIAERAEGQRPELR